MPANEVSKFFLSLLFRVDKVAEYRFLTLMIKYALMTKYALSL
jgi:hypothetical protein